jgi:signal transduction histidine kinase
LKKNIDQPIKIILMEQPMKLSRTAINVHFFTLALVVLATLFTIHACTTKDHASKKKPKFVYGSTSIFPPFEFLNEKGQPEGFNVDLIREIGNRMDFEVVFELDDWGKVKERIKNRKGIDIGDMYINKERMGYVDFSNVHSIIYHEFVTRRDTLPKLTLDSIKGLRVIVEDGTSVHEYLSQDNHGAIIIPVASEPEALRLLHEGKYDCAIVTQFSSNNYIIENGLTDLTTSGAPFFPLQLAFHVQKGNQELLDKINKGLTQVKLDGTYSKIYSKWFELGEKHRFKKTIRILIWILVTTIILLLLFIMITRYLRMMVEQKTRELNLRVTEIDKVKNTLSQQNNLLKETNKQLDTFVYSISHYIRGPISSALGVITLIRLESLESTRMKHLGMIESSLHRLEKFTRATSEYLVSMNDGSNLTQIDFYQMVQDIFSRALLSNAKTNIDLSIDNKIAEGLTLDKSRLTIVLSNIIDNSIRYSDDKKQTRYVKVALEKDADNYKITIEDNGEGIQEPYLESVFEIFFRANQKSDGSGLGLYIAKEALKKMNGTIHLTSTEGVGTKLTILIPQATTVPNGTINKNT